MPSLGLVGETQKLFSIHILIINMTILLQWICLVSCACLWRSDAVIKIFICLQKKYQKRIRIDLSLSEFRLRLNITFLNWTSICFFIWLESGNGVRILPENPMAEFNFFVVPFIIWFGTYYYQQIWGPLPKRFCISLYDTFY